MYRIGELTSLYLGEQGEHLATEIRVDMAEWLIQDADYDLRCYVVVLRHGETDPYIAATTMDTEDDMILVWPVTSSDTAIQGAGYAAFCCTDGTRIIKSKAIRTEVGEIVPGSDEDEAPDPIQGWLDQIVAEVTAVIAQAEAATDFIDNLTAQATTLDAGSDATAVLDHANDVLTLGIPVGPVATIQSQATAYQNSTSGNEVPSGTWLDNQPVTPQGQYLWVRNTITWSGGSTTVIYTVSRMGMDALGSVLSVCYFSPDSEGNVDIPIITTDQLQAICV